MADRRPPPADRSLERDLRDLAREIAYPPEPDIAATVRARIAAAPAPRRRRRASPAARRFAFVALLLLILLGGALGALAPVREGIARRMGLEHLRIVAVTTVPTPTAPLATPPPPTIAPTLGPPSAGDPGTTATATATAPPTPTAPPLRAQIGTPAALPTAQSVVPFPIRVPSAAGFTTPDEVAVDPAKNDRVSLVYRARPDLPAIADTDVGLLLQEFRGDIGSGIFQKGVPGTARVEPVTIDGLPGYWIAGGLRALVYTDASGNGRYEEVRYAGNTLIWQRDGVIYRLESNLPKEDAVRVASSLR